MVRKACERLAEGGRGLVALTLAALCFATLVGCAPSAQRQERPPCPLQSIEYDPPSGFCECRRFYDATTGHTWWVLTPSRGDRVVVLDTAGTQNVG